MDYPINSRHKVFDANSLDFDWERGVRVFFNGEEVSKNCFFVYGSNEPDEEVWGAIKTYDEPKRYNPQTDFIDYTETMGLVRWIYRNERAIAI